MKLTPDELAAIADICELGKLSGEDRRILRDAVRHKRASGAWRPDRITGIYRLALDRWPHLEQDPDIVRRADKIYSPSLNIPWSDEPPAIPADLEAAYVAKCRECAELQHKLERLQAKIAETNRKKGHRGRW